MDKTKLKAGAVFTIIMALLVVGYLFATKAPDVDGIIIGEVAKAQESMASSFNGEGKSIAQAKADLYDREQRFNSSYDALAGQRDSLMKKVGDPQRLSDAGVSTWVDPRTSYYAQEGVKRYNLIDAAIGGADAAQTSSGVKLGQVVSKDYAGPESLYYTCLVRDNCYVTQSDKEHFARNGYLAVDVGTGGKNLAIHALDHMNREIEYTAKYIDYPGTTGTTVELYGEDNGTKFMWRIGHTHWEWNGVDYKALNDGKKIKTGAIVAVSGGEKEESTKNGGNQGATTGKHVHIEYLLWDGSQYVPTPYRIVQNINIHKPLSVQAVSSPVTSTRMWNGLPDASHTVAEVVAALKDLKQPNGNTEPAAKTNNPASSGKEMFPRVIFVTSFNPESRQTDGDPRTGAAGVPMKEGQMALSRDLLYPNDPKLDTGYNPGSPIKYFDKVKITSLIPQCNGVFEVTDTMNRRLKNRGDLFFENRSKNTSCWGVVEPI